MPTITRPPRITGCCVFVTLLAGALCLCAQTTAPKAGGQTLKPPAAYFEDIAGRAGLTALDVYGGDTHKEFIVEQPGNGAVIFDYDNDGWPDIFLPNGSTVEGFPPVKRRPAISITTITTARSPMSR